MSSNRSRILNPISDEFLEPRRPPFAPFIFVETTAVMPSSISMAAVAAASMKYVNLWDDANPEDLRHVQKLVQDHYAKTEGNCILFGRITGYRFVYSPTDCIRLDTTGNEIERKQGRFWPQTVRIQKQ